MKGNDLFANKDDNASDNGGFGKKKKNCRIRIKRRGGESWTEIETVYLFTFVVPKKDHCQVSEKCVERRPKVEWNKHFASKILNKK